MRTDYFGPFVQDKLDPITNMVALEKKLSLKIHAWIAGFIYVTYYYSALLVSI